MGACTKLSYSNVTPAAWNCVVKFAASHGVHVKSDKGKASKDGFTVVWDYNPTAKPRRFSAFRARSLSHVR